MIHHFGNILVVHNSGFHYGVSIYAQCSLFVSIHTKTLFPLSWLHCLFPIHLPYWLRRLTESVRTVVTLPGPCI